MINLIVGTSSISEKGHITIPKEIREKLGIVQGDRLIFDLRGDSIIVKKVSSNNLSEILDNQKAWSKSSLEFHCIVISMQYIPEK